MSTTRRITTVLAATAAVAGSALACSTPVQAATPPAAMPALSPASSARPTTGWSAMTIGTATGTAQLTLVSPDGKQYRVAAIGHDWDVADVSNDGRRILVANRTGDHPAFRVVDVRTGSSRAVAGRWFEMRFTNPTGQALVGRAVGDGTGPLVRTSLTGAVQARYAGTARGDGALPSQDGTVLVSRNGANRLQVNRNSGTVLRTLANPRGMLWCQPQHWSSATQFTAYCLPTGTRQDAQVYRFSTSGAAPVALTSRLPRTGALQFGYGDSWGTPKGQLVAAANSCGPARMGLVSGSRVTLLAAGRQASPLAVLGSRIWFVKGPACEPGKLSVTRHDLTTGRTVLLAGTSRNPGLSVTSVSVIDPKQ